jgi:excisionase family DNA binding protein
MTEPTKPMTTREFAEATGIPTAAISKLIRDGKIKAQKKGKAWMIPASQLESDILREITEGPKSATPRKRSKPAVGITAAKAPEAEVVEPGLPEQALQPAASAGSAVPEEAAPQSAYEPTPSEKSYSIPEFAAMTYLTEKGVSEWLRIGRLQSCKTESGEWRVLESNLNVPNISRLVRK